MIIPSAGIENRTGTVSQPAWLGSRNSFQLEAFGVPGLVPPRGLCI